MKKGLIFCLMFSAHNLLWSQVKQVARKEFEANEEGTGFTTILGENGLIIHGRVEIEGPTDEWKLTKYDTDFHEVHSKNIIIPDKCYYNEDFVPADRSKIFLFFSGKKGEFQLSSYDASTQEVNAVKGILPPKFIYRQFKVVGSSAFVSGHFKKKEDGLVRIDLSTGKTSLMLLHGSGMRLDIEDMQAIPKQNMIALTTFHGDKKNRILTIHIYNDKGEKVVEPFKVDREIDKWAISSSITVLGDQHFIISGTYTSDRDLLANGIYITEFDNGQQKFMHYNSFTDLKRFNEFLSARQKAKVEKKNEKKKAKGKGDFVEAYVTSHPVFIYQKQYVYIGEVYFPTYRTVTYTTYSNGTPVTRYRQVFDGYQYSHATIIGMDMNGNKRWDFCFEMWLNYKPFYVKRFIETIFSEEEIKLFFSTGTELKSYVIKGEDVSERQLGSLENQNEGDKVKWTSSVNSEFWYDNYFITYGSQSIKNKEDKEVKRKRRVFFVAKIKFY